MTIWLCQAHTAAEAMTAVSLAAPGRNTAVAAAIALAQYVKCSVTLV